MADKKTSLSPAKNIFKDQRVLLAIVIALIVVIISCINPNFIGINNIVAIFQQICVLGILTMAMSILLISGGIDLSIGNIMVVCGVVMYVVLDNGLPTFIAVLAGLVTGAACGLLNGAIIAKSKCIPLVITLFSSSSEDGTAMTFNALVKVLSSNWPRRSISKTLPNPPSPIRRVMYHASKKGSNCLK